MREKPKILATRTLATTRLFHIEELDLRFSNGVVTRFERLVSPPQGAVLIVAMPDPQTVLLVREYAAGADRYELALPKGRIEAGEPVLSAADREIQEELGYGAQTLEQISSVSLAPGYVSHTTHVVLARDLYPKRMEGDEPEELEVVSWQLDELGSLLARDDFTEARSIAALFLTKEFLAHGR